MPTWLVICLRWWLPESWCQSRAMQETRPCIRHSLPIAWLGPVSSVSTKDKASVMTIFRHFKTPRLLETPLEITLYKWCLQPVSSGCSISQAWDQFRLSASRHSSQIRIIRLSNNLVSTSYLPTRSTTCRGSTWSWSERKIRSSTSSIPMLRRMLNFHPLTSWMLTLTMSKVSLSHSRRRISSWCKR